MRFRSFLAAVVLSSSQLGATNILDFASISRSQNYTQTSAAQPANAQYQFSSQVRILNFGDFDSASMKVPGGVPIGMPVLDSFNFTYTSALTSNFALFNSNFPIGTYSFTATDSTNTNAPQTLAFAYLADSFASSIPYFTNFSALNGLDTLQDFNLNWNPMTGAAGDASFVFIDLFDAVTDEDISSVVINQAATSATLPAFSLAPNHKYTFRLTFRNEFRPIYTAGAGGFEGTGLPFLDFDSVTFATFMTTTPTPEPVTWIAVGAGLIAILGRRLRP